MSQHPLAAFRQSQQPPLSQSDLARKLDVTRATISRWEKGERFPERDLWARIKEVTGLSASDLSEAA